MMNKTDYLMISICFVFMLVGSLNGLSLVSADVGEDSSGILAVSVNEEVGRSTKVIVNDNCSDIIKEIDLLLAKNNKLYSDIYSKYEDNPNSSAIEKEIKILNKRIGLDRLSEKLQKCEGENITDGNNETQSKVLNNYEEKEKIKNSKSKLNSNPHILIGTLLITLPISGLLWFFNRNRKEDEFKL